MLRLAVPSGLLAIATVTWGQEAVGPVGAVLTLEQAVALALQNNRQVQNASLEVGKKIDQAAAARTSRLPAFNVYFLESYLLTPSNLPSPRVRSEHFPAQDRLGVRLFGQSDLDLRPEDDMRTLRRLAEQVKDIFRAIPAWALPVWSASSSAM